MACCSNCQPIASHFGHRIAERDREAYRRRGPGPTTALILAQLRESPLAGLDLLDIGGGIGVIGLELIGSGLRRVTLVEAAPAYLAAAREEFGRRGSGDRLEARLGDFADLDPAPRAAVVTLDRVVCCYPDYRRLLEQVAESTIGSLALSYPRDRWYVRLGVGAENLLRRLTGNPFRAFVHPVAEMTRVLGQAGLRCGGRRETAFWSVDLWTRSAPTNR
jgi:magnesium-protoporphyrin O-methyltransferase